MSHQRTRALSALEKSIEASFVRNAKALGCITFKLHDRNAPDRLILLPSNELLFIEFKRPGAKPRPEQEYEHDRLRARGFSVYVVDNKAEGLRVLSQKLYGDPDVLTAL